MRRHPFVTQIIVALLLTQSRLLAQMENEPCRLMLQNGLYKTYNINKTGNFAQDVRTYISSEEFKQDLKNGRWGGSILAVIDGAPVKLGADANTQEITTFQHKVTAAGSFSLNQSFYDYASTAIPDVDLAREYTNCLEKTTTYGLKVIPSISERDVLFVVTYRKQVSADPMPKVTFFEAKNGINVKKSFQLNGFLQDNNTISADRDLEKDLTLVLETDRGVATYRVPAEPVGFNKDIPVGTVITSYLNWTEFQSITHNNANNPAGPFWASKYSKWAPADGRPVPGSKFQTAASQPNVPDLRGVFIRGLNTFDDQSPASSDPARRDPDDRSRGSFQGDAFKEHKHSGMTGDDTPDHSHHFGGYPFGASYGNNNQAQNINTPPNGFDKNTDGASTRHKHPIPADGGAETRPKNVAIYYYIRIN